jgi:hypothetical protein
MKQLKSKKNNAKLTTAARLDFLMRRVRSLERKVKELDERPIQYRVWYP